MHTLNKFNNNIENEAKLIYNYSYFPLFVYIYYNEDNRSSSHICGKIDLCPREYRIKNKFKMNTEIYVTTVGTEFS